MKKITSLKWMTIAILLAITVVVLGYPTYLSVTKTADVVIH